MTDAYAGSCDTAHEPEQVYQFNSGGGGNVTVKVPSVGTDFNTVLYVRDGGCTGQGAREVSCRDHSYADGNEKITFQAPPNTDYWVFVDGDANDSGSFILEIAVVPTCGDGVVDYGEECDDGNLTPKDGCSESCRIEPSCLLPEGEPNSYNNPTLIDSACGTYRIDDASISPIADADHYLIKGLVEGAEIEAYSYSDFLGNCASGTVLVTSLWKAPIADPGGANVGTCSPGQDGSDECSYTASDGNCSTVDHLVASGAAGDYIVKVHSLSTVSTVDSYGLTVVVR